MACKGYCECKGQKKAIITGITGQDGSHLADLLLEKGYKVIGIARRSSTDNFIRISHLMDNPSFKVVGGDITDYSSMIGVLQEHKDACEFYNLAAQSHVGVSFKQPGLTWDVTAKGCLNILQAIVDLDLTKTIRFYQASSSEMFGKNFDVNPINGEKYQCEDTKFMPQSPYAIAKCAAHEAVRIYREAYGIHASCGILFNHEGPRRGEEFVTRKITKWIGRFLNWRRGQSDYPINVDDPDLIRSGDKTFPKLRLGNLEAFRDWGYAGDYVEAMQIMLQQVTADDYVVCTGQTHTIREFLDAAFFHAGHDRWSQYVVQDKEFFRPAEVDYLRGCNTKAATKLGWRPKHSFYDLVKKMVENDL